MQEHATDPGVYIRSMATRGHLGGLAWATTQALRVLDAAQFDVAVVETVGVGQSEVEVASTADSVVILLAPGMGDGIQAAKAGILEIGDIYVVNKADRDGADATVRELRNVVRMGAGRSSAAASGWVPPVVKTIASQDGGIRELVDALDAHRQWLTGGGALTSRRRSRAAAEIRSIASAAIGRRLDRLVDHTSDLADQVMAGAMDPYSAADALVKLV